ncbi:MAG: sigma-54 dependent transcriptional regulator [Acidobacteriota bacterium]
MTRAASGALRFYRGDSRTAAVVDGVPLLDRLEVSAERLEDGFVVVLAERIVLLLHWAEVDADGPAPPAYGMVGESDAIRALRRAIARVADVDVPVLVCGETGSGKELVARALHAHGPRPGGPFVAINLGALAPSLATAELFGTRKGAFTGAVHDQPGHFVQAHRGTLFLDEVGEASAELQVMLLRTLETGEVMPVGGSSPRRVDLRLISATDAPLEARVEAGAFRAPLLHRLAGYRLEVPPLRERREDIGRLLVHFLERERHRLSETATLEKTAAPRLDPVVVARLASHDWPGNVRELRNVARELVIDSRGAEHLVLSPRLDRSLPPWPASTGGALVAGSSPPTRRRRKPSDVSEDELLAALRSNRFDLKATAAALAVSRTGLYARIERSSAVRTAADVPEVEIRRAHQELGGDVDAMVIALEISARALRQRLKDLGLTISVAGSKPR